MNKLFLPLLLLIMASCGANDNSEATNENHESLNSYPKFEEVLTYLDKDIPMGCDNCSFAVTKKPEGYFLEVKTAKGEEIIETYKVWDPVTDEFQSLNGIEKFIQDEEVYFPPGTSEDYIMQMKQTYDFNGFRQMLQRAPSYDFHLYYGYDEWPLDIIDALENKPSKSLEELEMLARSYDMISGEYIHPGQMGDSPFKGKYENSFYEKIEPERVEGIIENAEKSLEYYEQIIDVDPNYETFIIGDVKLKQANNCVHYSNALKSVKENELATSFLDKVAYPQQYIEISKALLNDCAQNGFLFTNGDSDTFPLWYVQQAMEYRKDVAVLNLSLMNSLSYLKMFKEVNQISSSLPFEELRSSESLFLMVDKESTRVFTIQELINILVNQAKSGEEDYSQFEKVSPYVKINYQGTEITFQKNGQAFFLGDIAMLDFINQNPANKVNFANRQTLKNFGISDHHTEKTMSVQFTPEIVEPTALYSDETIENMTAVISDYSIAKVDALGRLSFWKIANWMFMINHLTELGDSRAQSLALLVDQQLPDSELLQSGYWDLLNIKLYIKANIDNENMQLDFDEINSKAIEELNSLDISSEKGEDNYRKLSNIFSVYRSLTLCMSFDSPSYETIRDNHNNVLAMIKNKIEELLSSSEMDRFKWTKEKLASLDKQIQLL